MTVTAGTQQLGTHKYATGNYDFNGISQLGESALRIYSIDKLGILELFYGPCYICHHITF